MIPEMTPIEQCAEMAGLRGHELIVGVSPSDKHRHMLARYRRAVSLEAARGRVVADIRNAVEIGACGRAADLLIVLRWLFAPGASCNDARTMARPRRRVISPRWRRSGVPSAAAQQSSTGGGDVVSLFDGGQLR